MTVATVLILVHTLLISGLEELAFGPIGRELFSGSFLVPLIVIPLAAAAGLATGVLDVVLTQAIMSRVDPARLEMDVEIFRELQEPYMAPPRTSVPRILIYTLGEEAIRGIIMIYMFYLITRYNPVATWLAGTLLYLFARNLPLYARAPKVLDDAVFSALLLFGGLPAAWLAHAVANIYITWPLQRHGGAARQA